MSDQPSSGGRPLIPGQIASWLRLVCLVGAALIVTAYTYLAVRQVPVGSTVDRPAHREPVRVVQVAPAALG